MSLCKYKHIFGKENEGIHQYRFLNLAIADVLGTIIIAVIIAKLFHTNFLLILLILFLAGIILHRVFCVNTTINKIIFGIQK